MTSKEAAFKYLVELDPTMEEALAKMREEHRFIDEHDPVPTEPVEMIVIANGILPGVESGSLRVYCAMCKKALYIARSTQNAIAQMTGPVTIMCPEHALAWTKTK